MRLIVSPGARRDLRKLINLSPDIVGRVVGAVDSLATNPRPPGCLLLRNYKPPTWRVRVGDWRILYEIDDSTGVVTLTGVRHRSKAY